MKNNYARLMKMEASILVKIGSNENKFIYALHRALHPDNLTAPPHLKITEKITDSIKQLTYTVKISTRLTPKNFDSLRGTIDEILMLTEMLEKLFDNT